MERCKRIRDVLNGGENYLPFFTALSYYLEDREIDKPAWLVDEETQLDILYYVRSRNKPISELIIFTLETIDSEKLTDEALGTIVDLIYRKYYRKWDRQWALLNASYEALHDFDIERKRTPDLTTATESDTKITTDETNTKYAFNSSEPVGTNNKKVETSGTKTNNIVSTHEGGTDSIVESGIKTRTKQELLLQELDVLEKNFFDMLFSDLDSELCLSIY